MLRKLIEHAFASAGITDNDAYICSLSSRTIVYKGQLTPEQVMLPRLVMSFLWDLPSRTGCPKVTVTCRWLGVEAHDLHHLSCNVS